MISKVSKQSQNIDSRSFLSVHSDALRRLLRTKLEIKICYFFIENQRIAHVLQNIRMPC